MSIIGKTEIHHYEDDIGGAYCLGSETESPRGGMSLLTPCSDKEKRIRREIANSNERRRMQSINAGFQSLRTLLPHHEGEKLSKAAILQQTAEYIYNLEQEKTTLLAQNCQLKRLIEHDRSDGECPAAKKRKTESGVVVVESADEGLSEEGGVLTSEPDDEGVVSPSNHQELIDIRIQLDRERGLRLLLEEKIRAMQRVQEMTSAGLRPQEDMEAATETVEAPPSPSIHSHDIKQESRVEVERISNSPAVDDSSSCNSEDVGSSLSVPDVVTSCVSTAPLPRSKVYIASASRPNLETIVEAIRHLEGDNLFEDGSDTQDAPLALTKHTHPYLAHPFPQQQRPGVIVVKHS